MSEDVKHAMLLDWRGNPVDERLYNRAIQVRNAVLDNDRAESVWYEMNTENPMFMDLHTTSRVYRMVTWHDTYLPNIDGKLDLFTKVYVGDERDLGNPSFAEPSNMVSLVYLGNDGAASARLRLRMVAEDLELLGFGENA